MVEKFQLLQTAHEVLSDPSKRATYDRTRGATGRATAAYTRTSTTTTNTTTSTPKNRYGRQSTGTNGFSKGTPNTGKPAFGYFTTREPPSSPGTRKTAAPPHAHPTGGFAKATRPGTTRTSPQKDKTDAYFGRFREKTTTSSTSTSWQQFSSAHTPRATPQSKAQQRKEETQKAAGVKTPKRTGPTKFGTTFQTASEEEGESEDDTFFSFSSNGGSFNGTENSKKEQQSWSERRSAYSHVFTGVKEDMRSPSKPKSAPPPNGFAFETKSTGFASDGFKFPPKTAETNGLGGGFAKETRKTSDAPPLFANGPARRKSSQTRSSSNSTTTPPTEPNEIPKTPPPVEERRFASAFSRLNVNTSPSKVSPTKATEKINIDDWTKKFEGMNPFMSPDTKKLSEDPKFWSSVPLKATPATARRAPVRGIKVKRGGGGLSDMSDMKRELPKTNGGGIKLNGVGVASVFATFNVNVPDVQTPTSFGVPPTSSTIFGGMPTSPTKPTTPLDTTQQQPTPAATPLFTGPSPFANSPSCTPHQYIPELYPPTPPKQLIPRPSSPKEFSFSVPPKAEMQSLAGEVQAYHIAYITERCRFEEALKTYEEHINFTDEHIVRTYLKVKEELILKRTEMEALHTLCLERWGSVAKFAGFTG